MEDLASLLFYLVVGLIWFLSSILGNRTSRRQEWEFPEPQAPEPKAPSKPQRPPVERIPARWRGQQEPPKTPRPAKIPAQLSPTPVPGRAAVGSTLTSTLKELLAAAEETAAAPEPLLEEPMPLLFDTDDLERGVIASEILGPPVALRARRRSPTCAAPYR
jgi:hypothetical protein